MSPWIIYAGATLLLLALIASKYTPPYGFSELAGFGTEWTKPRIEEMDTIPVYEKPNSGGYDGQFYAQIALDPTLRSERFADAIDAPSYRARRILLPALAHALGFGQPQATLQIYCLLNVAAWFATGALLLRWLPPTSGENGVRWCLCMLSMGALESVRYALTDLPALALMLATIRYLELDRPRRAIGAHIATVLTKETALINALVFLRRRRHLAAASALSAFVLGLWLLHIARVFPMTVEAEGNIGVPLFGIARGFMQAVTELALGEQIDRFAFRLLAIAGLGFQAVHLLRHRDGSNRIWIMGASYAILFATLGDNVWWGYWAVCRVALPMTIAFNILYRTPSKRRLWLVLGATNLTSIHAVVRWL